MSHAFRALLRKVGSGPHTSEDLSREEAAAATRMMLLQEATPAQIGAFMIAHRIKRPTGTEMAGMLDAYAELGPSLTPITMPDRPLILSCPYDGRSRTAPIAVLSALVLAAAGIPTILHGGNRMPTKEGVPLVELWQSLGVDWHTVSLDRAQEIFNRTGIGFVFLPTHFPLAQALVTYREEIGKRPPFSSLELMWAPYTGEHELICGYVHPPTEAFFQAAFDLRQTRHFTTVKGLEGSCDLPRDRTAIIGYNTESGFERLNLAPREFGFAHKEVSLMPTTEWAIAAHLALQGDASSSLSENLIWNAGFYLWRGEACSSIAAGLDKARSLLDSGLVMTKLNQLIAAI